MRYPIQALNYTGVLDHTLSLIRDHARLLFGIAVCLTLPSCLLGYVGGQSSGAGGSSSPQHGTAYIVGVIIGVPLGMAVRVILKAALITAVANVCFGRTSSIGSAYRTAFRRWPAMFGTGILIALVVGFGLLCVIIPGLYLTCLFSLVAPVVVLEGLSGTKAMQRSMRLIKGNIMSMIAIFSICMLVRCAVTSCTDLLPAGILQGGAGAIVDTVYTVVSETAFVFLYFSCRCKAENYDLDVLIEEAQREEVECDGAVVVPMES